MEKHLPMRNHTITFSYLLMKKEKPASRPENCARLVGNSLVEKGKTRQMLYRDSHRKFLSWLHREAGTFELPRGEIILTPEDAVNKGTEIRIRQIPECGLLQ